MEVITANVTAKARKATLNGRAYLVAPATLIVPGVLPGSGGRIYYSPDEVEKSAPLWNGMPLVGYHPTDDTGGFLSARTPEVMQKQGLGTVYNAAFPSGKLAVELWYDEELTRAFDAGLAAEHRIVPRLKKGGKIEVSTGLSLKKRKPAEGEVLNLAAGVTAADFDWLGSDYRPDHVATLPDQKGACGVKDGCGVFNGAVVNELSHDQIRSALQAAVKARFTQADPYCYVCEVYDGYFIYEQGMKAYRLDYTTSETGVTVSGDPAEVVRKIEYVPTSEAAMNRAQTIDWLVANCDCWKGQNEALSRLDDAQLGRLKAGAEKANAAVVVANAAQKGFKDAQGVEYVWNAEKAEFQAKVKPAETPAPQVPVAQPVRPMTDSEWLASAPAGVQSAVRNAMAFETAQKTALISDLTVNATEAEKPALTAWLTQKPLDELRLMHSLVPKTAQVAPAPVPCYGGAVPPPVGNAAKDDSDNLLPVQNWEFHSETKQAQTATA